MGGIGGVLVGVTQGEESQHALRLAIEEAMLRGVPVTVVTAWGGELARVGEHATRGQAQLVQDSQVSRALRSTAVPPVICRIIREGEPAQVLTSLARRADLLVLGRTQGPATTRVGTHCLQHLSCPVVFATSDRTTPSKEPV